MFLNQKAIKQFCNEKDRQATEEFIIALDKHVSGILERACNQFNGHKKRLPVEMLNSFK